MKLAKTLIATAAVTLLAGAFTLAFADDTNAPGKPNGQRGQHGGPGPLMEHLLPPHAVDSLNLTADQKTKLDGLEAAFKKDAAAWDAAHPTFRDDMRKARESDDKDAVHKLMEQRKSLFDTRKGYVDQFRASLTDDQKTKLDKALEDARARNGRGGTRGGDKGAPPKPPED